MEPSRDSKRKKDNNDDDDDKRREKKSKRPRSKSRQRSRSPGESRELRDSRRKRRHSKSRSPDTRHQRNDKESQREPEMKSEPPQRKTKDTDMLNTRTGGAYIPPARLRMMQAQITDKSSVAYQRLAWEALKKSIHGHINKINVGNIGIIIKELLKENIVRGRGLLCRSVIQAQAASPTFTNVYAALVSAVNSRFPNIGELLLKRLVIQFKRGFKRNDKAICISSASFIAHLVNQRVAHEILSLELLTLLVETPTDDSVEVAVAFLKECGQKLTEVSSKGVNAIFEMLRNILHEGQLDKRVQYMIEVMFQVWKDGFKDHPALLEELELVPEEEQFTHLLMLDDATDPQDILNVFKFDDKYEENEQKYKTLSKEILGSDAESGEEDGSDASGSDESDDEAEEDKEKGVTIIDNTETNLVALRRTIYLTINSSLDFEECAHKLMKMQLKPGQEIELCHMFLDCCAEQRTYEKFYGLLAQRFCNINRIYIGPFEEIFKDSYATAHRLDTNRLRNVSKFFTHLLFTDSISWEVLECVKLNEEDTTSSSRIYIKILFQELAEYMGLKKLNDRLKDPTLQDAFSGVFPRDNPKNTRFSINFFTSIGLGGLTDELREHLKQMPKNVPPPAEITIGSDSSSDSSSSSSSSDSSSDSSSSDSEEESSKKKKKDKKKSKKKESPEKPVEEEPPKERWGHDGFYDTYGKDARRNERNNIPRYNEASKDWRNDRSERDDERRKNREDTRHQEDDPRSSRSDKQRDRRDYDRSEESRTNRYSRNEKTRNYEEQVRSKSSKGDKDEGYHSRDTDREDRGDREDRRRNNDKNRERDDLSPKSDDRRRNNNKTNDKNRERDDRSPKSDDKRRNTDKTNNKNKQGDDQSPKSDDRRRNNDKSNDKNRERDDRSPKSDDRGKRSDSQDDKPRNNDRRDDKERKYDNYSKEYSKSDDRDKRSGNLDERAKYNDKKVDQDRYIKRNSKSDDRDKNDDKRDNKDQRSDKKDDSYDKRSKNYDKNDDKRNETDSDKNDRQQYDKSEGRDRRNKETEKRSKKYYKDNDDDDMDYDKAEKKKDAEKDKRRQNERYSDDEVRKEKNRGSDKGKQKHGKENLSDEEHDRQKVSRYWDAYKPSYDELEGIISKDKKV